MTDGNKYISCNDVEVYIRKIALQCTIGTIFICYNIGLRKQPD